MKQYPVITADGHLAENAIWNVPAAPENEVRGTMKTLGAWQIPTSYRALAMDSHGRVFGIRTMSKPRESGYVLEGRVSIEGKSYRAFTSSKMFTRDDNSLCDVAIVYVCGTPDMLYPDAKGMNRAERASIASRYFYEKDGMYADLQRYCTVLNYLEAPSYPENTWLTEEYGKEAVELRAKLVVQMGWTA